MSTRKAKRVLTKVVGSDQLNAYQTYIDALDNPFTRRNYEMHFQEFRKRIQLSKITLFAPGSLEAQESVDAQVFMTTDSDEYARTEEEKEEREQK